MAVIPIAHVNKIDKEYPLVNNVSLGKTQSGKLKFFANNYATTATECIIVMRSGIRYRGANEHTLAEHDGLMCSYCNVSSQDTTKPPCEHTDHHYPKYAPIPKERILAVGHIAQGTAGRMGSGEQIIIKLPINTEIRLKKYGRLYGGPSEYFYCFDGENVTCLSGQERLP